MKALVRQATLLATALTVGAAIAPISVLAQPPRRVVDPNAPRFMVLTFKHSESDRAFGIKTADAIRERLLRDFPPRQLTVITKPEIHAVLTGSGFDTLTPPDPITARLLGVQLRADEYLMGEVQRGPSGGYRMLARMVITADNAFVQPLPPADGANLGQLAAGVSAGVRDARKQLADFRRCRGLLTEGKAAEAAAAARLAITAYAQSTIGRVCLANAQLALKTPPDSIIVDMEKAIAIDSANKYALGILGQAYKDAGKVDEAVQTWSKLLSYYPDDAKLVADVVALIAGSGRPQLALDPVRRATENNPGDPALNRLLFLVALTAKDYKTASRAGEELARADTAAADTLYFKRMAFLYMEDSQPQKAAEATARGVAKFPNDAGLWGLRAEMLRRSGQLQQAGEAIRRALAIDPKTPNGWFRLAQIQVEMNQLDSALASGRRAVESGEDKALVGQLLLVPANQLFRQAEQTKEREAYRPVINVLSQLDNVTGLSPSGSFLLGIAAYRVLDSAVRENQKQKSCELATQADEMLTLVQVHLPKGGSVQPQTVGQILQLAPQYGAAIEGQKKKFCKSSNRRG